MKKIAIAILIPTLALGFIVGSALAWGSAWQPLGLTEDAANLVGIALGAFVGMVATFGGIAAWFTWVTE